MLVLPIGYPAGLGTGQLTLCCRGETGWEGGSHEQAGGLGLADHRVACGMPAVSELTCLGLLVLPLTVSPPANCMGDYPLIPNQIPNIFPVTFCHRNHQTYTNCLPVYFCTGVLLSASFPLGHITKLTAASKPQHCPQRPVGAQ